MSNILNGITEAKRSPEPDYNDPSWDEKVSSLGQKAKQAEVLKSKGKEPRTRWNPETKRYYVDFSDDDIKKESVGLPYPGTYEETNDMFKSKGQRRTRSLTTEQGVAEGVETPQQQQVRAAISKGMEKWDQNGLATYQSQPAKRHYFASSDWASGQLKGINSIDPDGTVVIELNDTTTAGLVKKLAALGGMPGVKTRQLKMTFDLAKANADGVTRGDVAEEKHSCPHCGGELVSEELMNEKKDACYYKVKSRYKVWPSAYASGALVKCRKKGADNWGNGSKNESSILEGIERADESLHDWFNKEKWVRMDTKGNIKGPCAKEPGEGKPKCLPQAKAHSLGKKGRASAAARKRREDPNPDRSGKAINVNTKKD